MARVLNWRPGHDERSRHYPIRSELARKPRSYTWPLNVQLDQGSEGACVGFAWAHELAAWPARLPVTDEFARGIYRDAQRLDPWPGESYDGTSVLAGAKAVQARGLLGEYRWAFGIDDVVATVGAFGPVVLGVPWLAGMADTDTDGFIHATGATVGGHAILARGVNLRGEWVTLHNSWGPRWGRGGMCRISFGDLATLLARDGEACVPVLRHTGRRAGR